MEQRRVKESLDIFILTKTPLPSTSSSAIGPPLVAFATGAFVAVTTITCAVGGTTVAGSLVAVTTITCAVGGITVGGTSVGALTGTNTVAMIGVGCTC